MSQFCWTGDLSVGIEEIDTQHKELIDRLDKLMEAMRAGRGKAELAETVKFLEDYVVTHFWTEEKLMSETFYPEYKEHKMQHEIYTIEIKSIAEQVASDGANVKGVLRVQRSLCDWIKNHIVTVDKKLGAYLKEKGKS